MVHHINARRKLPIRVTKDAVEEPVERTNALTVTTDTGLRSPTEVLIGEDDPNVAVAQNVVRSRHETDKVRTIRIISVVTTLAGNLVGETILGGGVHQSEKTPTAENEVSDALGVQNEISVQVGHLESLSFALSTLILYQILDPF